MRHPTLVAISILASGVAQAEQGQQTLTVVRDSGGVSALPYYEDLNLGQHVGPRVPSQTSNPIAPLGPNKPAGDSLALPVRSRLLTPGQVAPRPLRAPGMRPLFLIGDDDASRTWLTRMLPKLQALRATGLVVNVDSADALAALREHAPGLALAPVSGDDLARRLKLQHYPVLITATGIEP
jgi:integrating conjugative element protein (TIGR03765 family)